MWNSPAYKEDIHKLTQFPYQFTHIEEPQLIMSINPYTDIPNNIQQKENLTQGQ